MEADTFVIFCIAWGSCETARTSALYWNNETGWGGANTATVFTKHERETLRPPDGGMWKQIAA